MKYALYIGRWQTWHPGHEWLINQQLEKGKPVCIAIRETEVDVDNLKSPFQIFREITDFYREVIDAGMMRVIIIPDIASVNYGRGVGYEVIEHFPPEDIEEISGTKIRDERFLANVRRQMDEAKAKDEEERDPNVNYDWDPPSDEERDAWEKAGEWTPRGLGARLETPPTHLLEVTDDQRNDDVQHCEDDESNA